MMIVQFLPVAIVGPIAGVVVDRVDRRRLMIATDLLRGVLVLGLLLVHTREQVWIAYVGHGADVSGVRRFSNRRAPRRFPTSPAAKN